jgi:tRNA pseudouridine55 synthase
VTASRDKAGRPPAPHGVLVVDKIRGPTSHDVVSRVRRLLGTSRVGHAGTLDPMATGVLVVLVGEATKLSPYLTAHDKRYFATVSLGAGTDTLDAEGAITARAAVPAALASELERLTAVDRAALDDASLATEAPTLAAALVAERGRTEQIPPAYSAIQLDGQRSHDRARRGESVDLPPRPVGVLSLRVVEVRLGEPTAPELDIELSVHKGYYVRSFARDLGERLGVPAHLSSLRRLSSGPFHIDEAVELEPTAAPAASPASVAAPRVTPAASVAPLTTKLIPFTAAALRCLPACRLTEAGAQRARQGAPLRADDVDGDMPSEAVAACIDPAGRLVALCRPAGERLAIERGFATVENDTG